MSGTSNIKQQLVQLLSSTSDTPSQLKALQKLIAASKGLPVQDTEEVVNEVIQYSQHQSAQVKKLVYLYLTLISACKPEAVLHASNSISSDLANPNPLVRGSTLRMVTDLPSDLSHCKELVEASIKTGLKDNSGYVRSIAVDGVVKSSLHFEKKISRILDTDSDPAVVMRCVASQPPENVKETLLSLIERIDLVDDSLKVEILTRASRVNFKLDDDCVLDILNVLEPLRCDMNHVALCVEANSMMLKLSSCVTEVHADVLEQTTSCLLSLLRHANQNLKFVLLCSLDTVAASKSPMVLKLLQKNVALFFVLAGDSVWIKTKKIELLFYCIMESTASTIFRNILHHLTGPYFVSRSAFKLLCHLHHYIPTNCEKVIKDLLSSTCNNVVEQSLVSLFKISIQFENSLEGIIESSVEQLLAACRKCLSVSSHCACIHLLSFCNNFRYCKEISRYLEKQIVILVTNSNLHLQLGLLNCTTRLFLKWPHIFDSQLRKLFSKLLMLTDENEVKQQAVFYYVLLKSNINLLKCILEEKLNLRQFPSNVPSDVYLSFTSVKEAVVKS